MRDVVVTDCVRTAVGKMNGSLSEYDEQVRRHRHERSTASFPRQGRGDR